MASLLSVLYLGPWQNLLDELPLKRHLAVVISAKLEMTLTNQFAAVLRDSEPVIAMITEISEPMPAKVVRAISLQGGDTLVPIPVIQLTSA